MIKQWYWYSLKKNVTSHPDLHQMEPSHPYTKSLHEVLFQSYFHLILKAMVGLKCCQVLSEPFTNTEHPNTREGELVCRAYNHGKLFPQANQNLGDAFEKFKENKMTF